DPAHPLAAGAARTSESEPEREHQPGERAAPGGEHDAEPRMDDAHPLAGSGLGSRLPGARHVGQESVAGIALLVERLVAAIAVIADRRSTYEHARGRHRAPDRARDQPGPGDPALEDRRLARPGP